MNNLAISPYIAMHALQIQNTKIDSIRKVNIVQEDSIVEEVSNENTEEEEEEENTTVVKKDL